MPRPASRSRSQPDTRARIRASAIALFGRKGYDGVSLRDIAKESGVPLSTLTHHFPSKEALKNEALIHAITVMAGKLEGNISEAADTRIALRKWVASLIGYFRANSVEIQLIDREIWSKLGDESPREAIATLRSTRAKRITAELIEQARTDDAPALSSRRFHDVVASLIYGLTKLSKVQAFDTPPQELTQEALTATVMYVVEATLGVQPTGPAHDDVDAHKAALGSFVQAIARTREVAAIFLTRSLPLGGEQAGELVANLHSGPVLDLLAQSFRAAPQGAAQAGHDLLHRAFLQYSAIARACRPVLAPAPRFDEPEAVALDQIDSRSLRPAIGRGVLDAMTHDLQTICAILMIHTPGDPFNAGESRIIGERCGRPWKLQS